MIDRDSLFLNSLSEIEERINRASSYDIIMTAGLLRKLLLDGQPLFHQVNQNRNLNIRFVANELFFMPPIEEITFCSLEHSTDPEACSHPPLKRPIPLSLKQFLKHPVLICMGKLITVHELIDFTSHVAGAVHAGQAKSAFDKEMDQLSKSLFVGNLPAGLNTLQGVASIVLRGLAPLKERIIADLSNSPIL